MYFSLSDKRTLKNDLWIKKIIFTFVKNILNVVNVNTYFHNRMVLIDYIIKCMNLK